MLNEHAQVYLILDTWQQAQPGSERERDGGAPYFVNEAAR